MVKTLKSSILRRESSISVVNTSNLSDLERPTMFCKLPHEVVGESTNEDIFTFKLG